MEKKTALSQRENYAPSAFDELLWWLATAEKEILVDSVVDRNRFKIVGMTVLTTWMFATFTWTYFFSTIVDAIWIAVLLGIFMGFIILTIDRALIKGISKHNKKKLTPLLFRGLLALTIGMFMAQPAILYMFNKEIKLQTLLDDEQKKMTKRHSLNSLYQERKTVLIFSKKDIQRDLAQRYAAVEKARQSFLDETDGSGGTGKVGLKDVALAKKSEYRKLDSEYKMFEEESSPKLLAIDDKLNEIEAAIKNAETDFIKYLNNGFLTRIEALNNLLKNNDALKSRYYLILCILMLIELMPVIAKTMLPSGSYDEKVLLREVLEITIARSNIKKEELLKELYNQAAFDNARETITAFFALTRDDRYEKIRALSTTWKESGHQTFDGLWEKMKKEILAKQEN